MRQGSKGCCSTGSTKKQKDVIQGGFEVLLMSKELNRISFAEETDLNISS